MIRALGLIEEWGVYAYSPDNADGSDLAVVALLDDDDRTFLPVRDVRGLLRRGLVGEFAEDVLTHLVITDAGRLFLQQIAVSDPSS